MNLIDIHAHVHFPDYDNDREEVLRRTRAAGCGVINVGTDLKTSREVVKLAKENDLMWAAVGIHPHHCQGETLTENAESEIDWTELERLARVPEVVAIGECGLDYFSREGGSVERGGREKQIGIFEKQMALAEKVGKPLMIHCREAYDEVYDLLQIKLQASHSTLHAHLHFFAGDWPMAERFLELGCTLSFTGVLTFPPKADQPLAGTYDEVVRRTPLDRIMAETDAPYVAPVPHRGKRNEPLYVAEVVAAIARIKSLPLETVGEAVVANARRVFGLPNGLPK